MKLACVAIVKNEQNHVAEWIAYQLAIGFDTVIIFDNQSTDDTAARIRAFAPHHDVRLHEWTMTTPDYQTRCYEHAARSYTDEFDWLAFFDIDEFLVLDPGFDLKSILNLFPATPAIGVPWAMFGSSGHTEKPDGLLIEAFTHRSEPSFGPNRHIKSIIRPKHMLYCHNAHSFAMDGQYRSLTGKPLTFTQGGLLDTDPDYTLGKLHHYFTRSRAHWADKMQRGYHDTSREDSEFEAYDRNEIPDASARDLAPRVREILANLGTATAQLAPTFISPPAQSPNPQASPSFLKERSKELSPESIRRPGEWALLTEFGTLLCWHPPTRALSHRPPSNLADHTLLLWRCGDENELVAAYAGHPETIDPITGQIAPPALIPKLTPIPGLEPGDIAFKLANGAHLSAREAAAPGEPGLVDAHVAERKAWECFTPIPPAAAADLIDLASSRWIIGEIPESPLAATPRGRQHFAVGHRTYAIAESLPLSNVIRYPSGTISSAILTREGWQLDELRRFRPLIVFTLFDRTQDADRLRIAAHALHYLADYSGDCLVIGDQPPAVVAPLFPEPLRRNLHVHEIAGNSSTHAQTHQSPSPSSLGATLILPDLDLFNEYQPVLVFDGPVIPEAPIYPVLTAIRFQDAIAVTGNPPATLETNHAERDQARQATIFGIPDLRGSARTLRTARKTLRAWRTRNQSPNPSSIPPDHAILAYCAQRLHTVETRILTESLRLIGTPNQPGPRLPPDEADQLAYRFATVIDDDRSETLATLRAHAVNCSKTAGRPTADLVVGMMSDREVLEQFQSIGDNCEFGGVQRQLGIENLGFLKWCRTTPLALARGIAEGFTEIGNEDNFSLDDHLGEYFLTDKHYGISGHSFVKIGSVNEERFRRDQLARMKYLRNKFLEDLDESQYIYVYNCHRDHQQHEESEYHVLFEAIRARSNASLLVVTPASFSDRTIGTVEIVRPGLFRAFKDEYTTFDSEPSQYMPGWIDICRKLTNLIQEPTTPVKDHFALERAHV